MILLKEEKEKIEILYEYEPDDIRWTKRTVTIVSVVTFLSGISAGILGMGGGIFINVLMLALGLKPEIVAASTSLMIIFLRVLD